MEYSNTNYFFDVIGFIIPILALIYWTRNEPDGIWVFLKEIHENNLKDYEMDKELEEQERFEIAIQDQRGAISLAEKKAQAKGKAEGKAEGIESVAINLLQTGMAIEQVATVTGLSHEQLTKLKNQQKLIFF